jgi:hypothetical protein
VIGRHEQTHFCVRVAHACTAGGARIGHWRALAGQFRRFKVQKLSIRDGQLSIKHNFGTALRIRALALATYTVPPRTTAAWPALCCCGGRVPVGEHAV